MAREEIKLVGSFKDEITPQLKKLNKEIANIGRTFTKFNAKLAPVTKSFAKMAMSARTFNDAMKLQRGHIDQSSRAMREYSRQAGKMSGAMRKIQQERMKAQRQMGVSRAQMRKQGSGSPMGAVAPSGPVKSKSSKGAAVGFGASAGQSFMKNIASTAIGMGIANAFASGVQKLKGLIMAPFQKFQSAFAERMNDEMDDIKSAGGMYALDMDLTGASGNERLFKNYNEALRFQEEINTRMAQSASNLPGTTSDFVNMNRRMTDTIQMVMENNREAFIKLGEAQGADVSGGGIDAAKESMAQVGQNLTESLMLASAGQQGGLPMDIAIQQLMNKEQGKIKMQAFTNKFRAAFQKNPLLKNFLMRGEEELNKTAAGSSERLALIADIFDRAIPQEQINKMRGSLNGLLESVRSGLLDPQGGLFGMSRAVSEFDKDGNMLGKLMKKNVNDMGEILYKITDPTGLKALDGSGEDMKKGAELTATELEKLGLKFNEATGNVERGGKAIGTVSKSTTYLFEQMREIMANYGAVLTQFVGLLPTIFDPFAKMTKALVPMREMSIEFYRVFQETNKNLYAHVDELKSSTDSATKGLGTRLGKQVMQRSALSTLADFLAGTGEMSSEEMKSIKDQLVGKQSRTKEAVDNFDKTASTLFKTMFDRLMKSKFIEELGKMGGIIVGGIMETTFKVVKGLFDAVKGETGNAFIKGFKEGFEGIFKDMGGFDGFMKEVNQLLSHIVTTISEIFFNDVLPLAMKGLMDFIMAGFNSGPFGVLISGGILSGLTLAVVSTTKAMWNLVAGANRAAFKLMTLGGGGVGRTKGRAAAQVAGFGASAKEFAQKFSNFFFKDVNKLKADRLANVMKFGPKAGGALNAAAIGKTITAGLKSGLKMGAVGGVIKAILSLFEGKSPLDAITAGLASAGGSAIGAAIGTVIAPGIGTAIGGLIGGFIGDNAGVVEGLKQAFVAIKVALDPVVESIGSVFSALFDNFKIIMQAFGLFGGEMDDVTAIVMIVKIALTPVVAAFQLLGQVINVAALGFHMFRSMMLNVAKGLIDFASNLPVVGGHFKELSETVGKSLKSSQQEEVAAKNRIETAHKRNMEYYKTDAVLLDAKKAETQATQNAADAIQNAADRANTAKFNDQTTKALKEAGVTTDQITKMEVNQPEIDAQIAALRGTGPKPTEYSASIPATPSTPATTTAPAAPVVDSSGAKQAMETVEQGMSKIGSASQPAAEGLDKLASSSPPAADGLEKLGPSAEDATNKLGGFADALPPIPAMVEEVLVGAATTAGSAITQAAAGLAQALNQAAQSIKQAATASATAKSDMAGGAYSGHTGGRGTKTLPLADAIAKERSMMPSGADLMIANTSETVIPAFDGHVGEGFKGFSFEELESAAGFNRMATYTDQIAEIADKTAQSFSMAGALGGGSATLNAMEALGHQHGLQTTSGYRPGDPGFHGVNRARDLSNGGGETPEMNKVANIMASQFGSSLTELIYTPMGFSIKNGQKTGLISPDNHYHHIHVAVAEGLAKAAVFSSQQAAMQYERQNMPAGAEPMKVDLSSMTANSSEFKGGGGDINIDAINISGVQDPEAIANQVAEEILVAVRRSAYGELYTS